MDVNPLPPDSSLTGSTSINPKAKRGRKFAPTDPAAPAPALRRSKRHSTETPTPGPPSSVKVEPEEAAPPPKKRKGRPSKAAATAPAQDSAALVKAEEVTVTTEVIVLAPVNEPPAAIAGSSGSSARVLETKPKTLRELAASAALARGSVGGDACCSSFHTVAAPAAQASATLPSASTPVKTPNKSTTGKSPKKAKDMAEKPEKRAFKIRAKAPQATMQRAQRVMTQRMFLVHREKYPGTILAEQFKVLGSTGNVYTIKIDSTPSCNCPDCLKGNLPCKHIIFVFLKVLKVPTDSPLWYQKSFILSELEEIFTAAPAAPAENLVSVKVRNAYLKAMGLGGDEEAEKAEEAAAKEADEAAAEAAKDGRKWTPGDDCPVCYDEMTEDDDKKGKLVSDEAEKGCGKRWSIDLFVERVLMAALHAQCFKMWAATAKAKGDDVTCVWCRTPWPTADAAGAGKGKGKAAGGLDYSSLGYLNMADVAGMSRERDTSSYYQGPIAGRSYADRYAYD